MNANEQNHSRVQPKTKNLNISLLQSRNELMQNVSKVLHESDNQTINNIVIEEMSPREQKGYRTERKLHGKADPIRM